jgi:hypothetical protein
MFSDSDMDPCEIYFSDYREVDGRLFPFHLEVRHGDGVYQVLEATKFDVAAAAPGEGG